jgi:hypothetical protein
MPIRLAPYDPSRDFVAKVAFRAGGKIWSKDEPFDKNFVNGRVLEQLYEQRRIGDPDDSPKLSRSAKRIAGHCRAFVDSVRAHVARVGQTLSPVEAHEQLVAEKQSEDTEGSSGAQPSTAGGGEGGSSKEPDTPQGVPAAPEQAAPTPQDTQGAPGTAREAPGAEGSTSASSGSASAPPVSTVNAGDADSSPVTSEAAGAPAGEAVTTAATNDERDAKVEQLMIDHSQSQLIDKAADLPGVNSKTPKKKLAELLVDAGRS